MANKIMPRCFIGFMLPENLKTKVEVTQKEVKELLIDCKLVERDNLHICFSFLGDVEDLNEVKRKLDEVAHEFSKVEVSVKGLKAIPNENYIRVLVLDVQDSGMMLSSMQKEICQQIGGDGKPPHVTLCRVRNVANKNNILRKIEELKNKNHGSLLIDSIQLIESRLSRSGPTYNIVHESKLD